MPAGPNSATQDSKTQKSLGVAIQPCGRKSHTSACDTKSHTRHKRSRAQRRAVWRGAMPLPSSCAAAPLLALLLSLAVRARAPRRCRQPNRQCLPNAPARRHSRQSGAPRRRRMWATTRARGNVLSKRAAWVRRGRAHSHPSARTKATYKQGNKKCFARAPRPRAAAGARHALRAPFPGYA